MFIFLSCLTIASPGCLIYSVCIIKSHLHEVLCIFLFHFFSWKTTKLRTTQSIFKVVLKAKCLLKDTPIATWFNPNAEKNNIITTPPPSGLITTEYFTATADWIMIGFQSEANAKIIRKSSSNQWGVRKIEGHHCSDFRVRRNKIHWYRLILNQRLLKYAFVVHRSDQVGLQTLMPISYTWIW